MINFSKPNLCTEKKSLGDLCREACQYPRPILAIMYGKSPKKLAIFILKLPSAFLYDSEYGVPQQTKTGGPLPFLPIF